MHGASCSYLSTQADRLEDLTIFTQADIFLDAPDRKQRNLMTLGRTSRWWRWSRQIALAALALVWTAASAATEIELRWAGTPDRTPVEVLLSARAVIWTLDPGEHPTPTARKAGSAALQGNLEPRSEPGLGDQRERSGRLGRQPAPRARASTDSHSDASPHQHRAGAASPSRYTLAAEQPGAARARFFPLSVEVGQETQLVAPLQLRPPLKLQVEVTPAKTPEGKPWAVQLEQESSSWPGRYETAARGVTSETGHTSLDGLAPGAYVARLLDAAGNALAWEEVALSAGAPPLRIVLDLVAVRGSVLLGDRPLPSRLLFGGRTGAVKIPAAADAEGRFETTLPGSGRWQVFVDARDPTVRRAVSIDVPAGGGEVIVQLPSSRLSGTTVDSSGEPLERAVVKVAEAEDTEILWAVGGR
jgi:hypothetical protein